MSVHAERLKNIGINKVFVVFITTTIAVGLAATYGAEVEISVLFRGVVLANVVLAGYLVLVRNLVGGIAVYLYALVFFNYYWRVLLPGSWPDLDLPRLMFVFIWLIFLLEVLLGRRWLLPGGIVGLLMVIIMSVIVLSMLTLGKRSIRVLLNGFLIPYAMFALSKNVFVDRRTIEKFVFWFSVPLALYFPLTSILEHYRVYALLFPRYIGKVMLEGEVMGINWGGRAMGTFVQPAVTGCAMVMVFVLAIHSLSRIKGVLAKLYSTLLFLVTPVGVFFTYTRSVYVGFAAGLVVLTLFSRKLRLGVFILLVAIGLAVLGNWSNVRTAERTAGGIGDVSTAQGRVVVIQASLRMFADNPFFGCGYGQFLDKARPYIEQVQRTFLGYREESIGIDTNQHNQFSSMLTELGLLGFVPFLLMYILLFRMLGKARFVKAEEYDSEFVVVVWAAIAPYISVIMFIEPRWFEFMNTLPFMLMGIIAGGYERARMRRLTGLAGNAVPAGKEYAS